MNRAMRRASTANGRSMMHGEWTRWESLPLVSPLGEKALPNTYAVKKNNYFIVQMMSEPGGIIHLWIRRNDGAAVRSWSDMQRIKNELVGAERVAVEVYPPESELVDDANIYHLWVFPAGQRLGFGL